MVYRGDATTTLTVMTGAGDEKKQLPNATWISLASDKLEIDGTTTPSPPATEEGESRFKRALRTAAKVGIFAVAGIGLVAVVGAAVVMAASASPDFEPPEGGCLKKKEKMMKRPDEEGYMPRDDFEADPRDYFKNLRLKKKIARAMY